MAGKAGKDSAVDSFDKSPESRESGKPEGRSSLISETQEAALAVVDRLVPVLERERDLLVSGEWEGLDAVLESKETLGQALGELLSKLSPEDREMAAEGEDSKLRSALLHLSELTAVNMAIARESSLIIEQLLREVSLDAEGGGTYGASGSVDPSRRPSPALVSTRG